MRYIVFGAGAVGGVIGARLVEAGFETILVARGEHASCMKVKGLTFKATDGTRSIPVRVVSSVWELQPQRDDVIILTVKTQDTMAALESIDGFCTETTALVCAQNGVHNEQLASRRFANVYGVVDWISASHLAPGEVQAHFGPCTGILDIGRYPSGADDVSEAVSRDLAAATFSSRSVGDIMRWKYAKLIRNLGNAVEALSVEGDPLFREICLLAEDEGALALEAAGIPFSTRDEERSRRGALLQWDPTLGQSRPHGSIWQSMKRGTGAVEADYLNGEVVLLGRQFGTPTPLNEWLQLTARRAARGLMPPGQYLGPEILRAAGLGSR